MVALARLIYAYALFGLMVIALGILTGCTTPPAPSSVIAQCYPIVPYTPDQEAAQASAYASLAPSSPLRSLIDDYGHERAALRACAGVK